jgi:hypothetical protein
LPQERICTICEEPYILRPDKPGLIHHCPACSKEKVERVGGFMTWEHKTAPTINILPMKRAKELAKLTRRNGSTIASIVENKTPVNY